MKKTAEKRGVQVNVMSAKYSQLCAHVVHLVISCFYFAEDGKKNVPKCIIHVQSNFFCGVVVVVTVVVAYISFLQIGVTQP